jgi:tRNA pseudouridine38-40 synthase
MPTFKITIAYDGTPFVGWQRQARGTSIQGLIEEALRPLDGRAVTVHGAGRTDAGAHALGQVASFTLARAINGAAVMRAVNSRLPPAIRIVAAEEVDAAFHARYGAPSKTYWYRILNRALLDPFERAYAWHVAETLDLPRMQTAARTLEGRYDFAAFQARGATTRTTEREIYAIELSTTENTENTERKSILRTTSLRVPRVLRGGEAFNGGELITVEVTGAGFLRHMVRIIVGSLVEIGRGRRAASWLAEVLASRDRTLAGPTAPAHGLFLARVTYDSERACG